MSYILDALNKSSENRARLGIGTGKGSLPTENGTNDPRTPRQPSLARDWLPWFVALVALLWGGVIALTEQPTPPSPVATSPSPSIVQGMTAAPPAPAPVALPSLASVATKPVAIPSPATQPKAAQPLAPPPEIVGAVERLSISAHMYSSRPEDRLLIVEGTALRQGEALANGMRLEEISPTGATFMHQGHKVRKQVFQ